jgi:hypothetical protein
MLHPIVQSLTAPPVPLPDTVGELPEIATRLSAGVAAIPAAQGNTGLADMLRAIDAVQGDAELLEKLLPRIAECSDRVLSLLGPANVPSAERQAVIDATEALRATLRAGPLSQAADTHELGERISTLVDSIRVLFEKVPADLPEKDAILVGANAGRYEDAARTWARAAVAHSAAAERALGKTPDLADQMQTLGTTLSAAGWPFGIDAAVLASLARRGGSVPAPSSSLVLSQAPPAAVPVRRYWSWRQLLLAKAAETLVAAVLVGLIAYATFWKTFVGTPADLAAVFFWAFGIDLTIDAIVNTAKSVTTLPNPAG